MTGTNGATRADDLFSLDALEHDQTKAPFEFEAGGRVWTMSNPDDMDFRTQDRIAQAATNAALLEQLLGDQYAEFQKLDVDIPAWKLEALFERMGTYYGIDLPESQASPVSSNRAARRSRRTSGGTTASGSRTSARSG
jgi:hypothetical protein